MGFALYVRTNTQQYNTSNYNGIIDPIGIILGLINSISEGKRFEGPSQTTIMVSYTGIISELCSSFLYALTGLLVKAVKSVDVLQMVCLQTTFELIVMLPITSVRHGQKIAPVHNKRLFSKLLLRGVWGAINIPSVPVSFDEQF